MITVHNTTCSHVMSTRDAESLAETLNIEETDGWAYEVEVSRDNHTAAFVAVYDEHNEKVGYL